MPRISQPSDHRKRHARQTAAAVSAPRLGRVWLLFATVATGPFLAPLLAHDTGLSGSNTTGLRSAVGGTAAAAVFDLADGVRFDGDIARAGRRFVTIRTSAGVRLVQKAAIERVTLVTETGEQVAGAFEQWRDGAYVIRTDDGALQTAREGGDERAAGVRSPAPTEQTTAAAPAQDPAPTARETSPTNVEAVGDLAWMASPELDNAEDTFRVMVDQRASSFNFENADRPSTLDRTEASRGGAEAPRVSNPAQLTFRSPAPPTQGPVDETAQTRRPDQPAPPLTVGPDTAAEAQASTQADGPAPQASPPLAPPRGGASDAAADLSTVRALSRGAAAPEDRLAQLGQSGGDPVRGLLDGLIRGDRADDDLNVGGFAPPEVETQELPPVAPPGAASASVENPTAVEQAADAARVRTPPVETAQAAAPTAVAPAPDGPLRAAARDYVDGVVGPLARGPAPSLSRSCARLGALEAPPAIGFRMRPTADAPAEADAAPPIVRDDPASLVVAKGGALSDAALAALFAAFYETAGASLEALAPTTLAPAGRGAARRQELNIVFRAPDPRLIRPSRMAGHRYDRLGEMSAALKARAADVTLSAAAVEGVGPEERRLIGFEAIALIASPSNPLGALAQRDLRALLTGAVSDWSMLSPSLIGAPRLYLPPPGSATMDALLAFSGARRARPVNIVFLPDPAARIQAALADPMGLAAAPFSAIGDAKPLGVGQSGAGVSPSLDTIRSGTYPIVAPLYASALTDAAHPAAAIFRDFLITPAGQRALFDAGLTPIAACDPSTCRLEAPGLADARDALKLSNDRTPLLATGSPPLGGDVMARLSAPATPGVEDPSFLEALSSAIASLSASAPDARLGVVSTLDADSGSDAAIRGARIRAEATALALRCAGLKVSRIAVAPAGGGAAAGRLQLIIQTLPPE